MEGLIDGDAEGSTVYATAVEFIFHIPDIARIVLASVYLRF